MKKPKKSKKDYKSVLRNFYFQTARLRAGINFAVKMIKDGQNYIDFLNRIEINFTYLSIFMACFSIFLSLTKMLHGAWATQGLANRAERGTNVFMGAFGVIVAIVNITLQALLLGGITSAIVTAAPILLLIGAARGVIENACKIGAAIYDRFFSDKSKIIDTRINELKIKKNITQAELTELTQLTNKQIAINSKISDRTEGLAMCALAVTAAILFFTPFAPIGTFILGGLFVYGVTNAFQLNPIKWTCKMAYLVANKFKPNLAQKFNFLNDVNENDIKNKYEMEVIPSMPPKKTVIIDRIEEAAPVAQTKKISTLPLVIPTRTNNQNETNQGSWHPGIFFNYGNKMPQPHAIRLVKSL